MGIFTVRQKVKTSNQIGIITVPGKRENVKIDGYFYSAIPIRKLCLGMEIAMAHFAQANLTNFTAINSLIDQFAIWMESFMMITSSWPLQT